MKREYWYIGTTADTQAPYPAGKVRYKLRMGYITMNEPVSCDGVCWEPASQVPEFVPERLLKLDGLVDYKPRRSEK